MLLEGFEHVRLAVVVGTVNTAGQKTKRGLKVEKYHSFLGQLNCDKPLTTRSQCHIAYFTALALGHFVPSGLVQ